MTFKDFRALLINQRIVSWNGDNEIILDNGLRIAIEEKGAFDGNVLGHFENVKIDAVIIGVTEPKCEAWENGSTFGCSAEVKILYNDLDFCRASITADAGNDGYYYSLASFLIRLAEDSNNTEYLECIDIVSSDDT